MRALGIVVALLIAAAAVMVYVQRVYIRPRQTQRSIERLERENEELDRRLADLHRNERKVD